MARMLYCSKSKSNLKESLKNNIEKYDNPNSLLADMVKLINEYNYSVEHHKYWMTVNKNINFKNENMRAFHNAVATNAQSTGKTIYSENIEMAKWQIEAVKETLEEYCEKLSEKESKSIMKKISTRISKMNN